MMSRLSLCASLGVQLLAWCLTCSLQTKNCYTPHSGQDINVVYKFTMLLRLLEAVAS